MVQFWRTKVEYGKVIDFVSCTSLVHFDYYLDAWMLNSTKKAQLGVIS